jgi:hypothetical protein
MTASPLSLVRLTPVARLLHVCLRAPRKLEAPARWLWGGGRSRRAGQVVRLPVDHRGLPSSRMTRRSSIPACRSNATRGLRQRPEGAVCLYGPSSTGKTAFAREVAKLSIVRRMAIGE